MYGKVELPPSEVYKKAKISRYYIIFMEINENKSDDGSNKVNVKFTLTKYCKIIVCVNPRKLFEKRAGSEYRIPVLSREVTIAFK